LELEDTLEARLIHELGGEEAFWLSDDCSGSLTEMWIPLIDNPEDYLQDILSRSTSQLSSDEWTDSRDSKSIPMSENGLDHRIGRIATAE
jgi:hypothetical protein